jgi:hypothetical protein
MANLKGKKSLRPKQARSSIRALCYFCHPHWGMWMFQVYTCPCGGCINCPWSLTELATGCSCLGPPDNHAANLHAKHTCFFFSYWNIKQCQMGTLPKQPKWVGGKICQMVSVAFLSRPSPSHFLPGSTWIGWAGRDAQFLVPIIWIWSRQWRQVVAPPRQPM